MSVDASQLTIALEEQERWRRTLSVTVPAPIVSQERDRAAAKLAKRLKLPGFRSGRVPSSVLEKRYGSALNQEVLDRLIGDAFKEALRAEALEPISEGHVENLHYAPDDDLTFAISFDVQPELNLARLGGFSVERPEIEVGEPDVERVLERLRDQNGSWVPVEEGVPAEGDLVAISVVKLLEGDPEGEAQEYELVLGEGEAIPNVEAAIATLSPGETGEFTVTFPEDFPNEERRGEKQHLKISLESRKERELPELNDEFARSVGDFEDLAALRAKVREDLGSEAEERAEAVVRGRLLQNVLEANPFDAPGSMIDRYIEGLLGNTEDADQEAVARAREQLRPEAEQAVKRMLAIDHVARAQDLQPEEKDLDERIESIAQANEVSAAQVYASLQKSGRLEVLEREITEQRVFEFLKEQSEIVPAGV